MQFGNFVCVELQKLDVVQKKFSNPPFLLTQFITLIEFKLEDLLILMRYSELELTFSRSVRAKIACRTKALDKEMSH